MSETTAPRIMPKRKGGTRFPRHSLKAVLPWAKKLVSKTHLGPQPDDVIFAGVVEGKGSNGEVKVSALKQYGLLEGSSKAYSASALARAIAAAPSDETPALLRQAALAPDVFEAIFKTFHGDEVTIAKLRQRAADLKVHPDETDRCVKLYAESLEFSGLARIDGDVVRHASDTAQVPTPDEQAREEIDILNDEQFNDQNFSEYQIENEDKNPSESSIPSDTGITTATPKAIFNVNISLDSSLDTDKLESQLRILKKYGAI